MELSGPAFALFCFDYLNILYKYIYMCGMITTCVWVCVG